MKLTAVTVEKIRSTDKRQEIPDALCVGLYLVVQPTGRKSWQVRYRAAGVHRRMTLGAYPLLSLAEAREKARDVQREAMDGGDPAADAKANKAAILEGQLSERDKIKTLVHQFDKRHLSHLKSGAQARQFLERFVVKAWGGRDIHTITKRDVIDLLDEIVDSGRATTANRVLAHMRKFFNWTVERDILAISPTTGVKPPAKETSRDRVLTDQEIHWFWQACDLVGQPWGPLAKFLLLTGQRLNEAAQMTDNEIEGDLWRMKADRVKNGRAHDVPLSEAARGVLAGVERVRGKAGYVFSTNGRSPVQGFHKSHGRLAETMATIAADEMGRPVDIPKWGFHDLRRTAATGMARLGIAVRVTEAVLNHVSGTGGGIVAVYQRHDYADEKRRALDAWARLVADLVEGRPDNVVEIADAKA